MRVTESFALRSGGQKTGGLGGYVLKDFLITFALFSQIYCFSALLKCYFEVVVCFFFHRKSDLHIAIQITKQIVIFHYVSWNRKH